MLCNQFDTRIETFLSVFFLLLLVGVGTQYIPQFSRINTYARLKCINRLGTFLLLGHSHYPIASYANGDECEASVVRIHGLIRLSLLGRESEKREGKRRKAMQGGTSGKKERGTREQ